MRTLAFLAAAASATYLYIGVHVIRLDPRSKAQRLFLLICLCLSYWAFWAFWLYQARTVEEARRYVMISFPAPIFFYALTLHFCLEVSGVLRRSYPAVFLLYTPAVYFLVLNFTSHVMYEDFVNTGGFWEFRLASGFGHLYSFILYYAACLLASVALLYARSRITKTRRERKQSRLLFASLLLTLILGSLEGVLLPTLTSYRSAQPAPLIFLIWIGGVWFAMLRYRFLSVTSCIAAEALANGTDGVIMVLDTALKAVMLNRKTRELAGPSLGTGTQLELGDLFAEHDPLSKELALMLDRGRSEYRCRLTMRSSKGNPCLLDARFVLVRDRFRDPVGFMLLGRPVRELNQVRAGNHITRREAEIVGRVLAGESNREIAEKTELTERTVKAHLTSIYNKLGVRNRTQLLVFLREYDLVSSPPKGRTLLVPKQPDRSALNF